MVTCPDGGIGIRARLKIVSRKGCGFDPHSGHTKNKKSVNCVDISTQFTLFYYLFKKYFEAGTGIEPVHGGFADRSVTTSPPSRLCSMGAGRRPAPIEQYYNKPSSNKRS